MVKNLYQRLTLLGVTKELPIEISQRVRLLNIFVLFPILLFVFFIAWGIYSQHFFPAIAASLMLGIISFSLYSNKIGNYAIAKSIFFTSSAISLLIIQNTLDIDFTITGYYFPLIVAFLILYDVKKEWINLSVTFLITIACLIGCFALKGHLLYNYEFTEQQYNISIFMSYSIPFALVLVTLFAMVNINTTSQEILIKAKQDAETAYKAKSNFLSVMSHELRTPLNGIVGATNLLKYEQITQSQKGYLDILSHSSDQMLSLVNHILDFSKIEIGKINLDRNTFNLKTLLVKICQTFESKTTENVKFKINIDESLNKMMVSDDLRLLQILNNLLSNAFKFTAKGYVELNAKLESQKDKNLTIAFSVEDSGIGIKENQIDKIFESFEQADKSTTRNFGGTGLGLSISKQLVELFGSKLVLESTYGVGSIFKFTVDVELGEEIIAEPFKEEIAEQLNGLNILVVEDNAINMMVLTTFLKKWNVSFSKATNGIEALERFQETKFDLILMDLEMPVMDGYTAIKEIRKADTNLPVLAFTAALYDNMSTDLIERGFNDYVHKPFNPQSLFKKLQEYAVRKKTGVN